MQKRLGITSLAAVLTVLSACAQTPSEPAPPVAAAPAATQSVPQAAAEAPAAQPQAPVVTNPLFVKSSLPYEAPPYDQIKLEHFLPAFDKGMADHAAEIQAIANSTEAPTFQNTIVAMELAGATLSRTSSAFFSLTGTISNEQIRGIQSAVAPKLAAHRDSVLLNPNLFARVEAVYNARTSLQGEDLRLVEESYKDFVRAGAKLSPQQKEEIKAINSELSKLTTEFGQTLLKETEANAVVVEKREELAGLSDSEISGLAAAAEKAGHPGKFLISLQNTTRQPLLSSLENRDLRKRLWEASANRGASNNGPTLIKIASLRVKKAKILGYSNWASYVLEAQMAKTPDAVFKMLDDLAPQVAKKSKAEAKVIQKMIRKSGGKFELEPWDWFYYAEKVRAKSFNIDENEVKAYFELEHVMKDGVFYAMNQLFGISFQERNDLPTYHPDVRTFEVFDASGESVGLFYADYFAREGKRGGAWMNAIVGQSHLLGRKPLVVNVLNIPKPAAGEPALISFDFVQTMFHEMGHAVHGLFSNAKYPSLAGTAVPRDYVEFPSQLEEDWAIQPQVLQNFAKHYKSGEPISKALMDKVLASQKFNQGFDSHEYLASALLDLEWHTLKGDESIGSAEDFEQRALKRHGLLFRPVPPRYKSPYFSHVFAGGYSAGYYSYIWTEVLAADCFAYLLELGGLKKENGDKLRANILSKGNTMDPMQQYINFRGKEPSVEGLLKRRGLK